MAARDAFHVDLRFPELLYDQGLSPHQQEKILIQLETVAQGYPYSSEIRILNKFDVFTEIRVTPLSVLSWRRCAISTREGAGEESG